MQFSLHIQVLRIWSFFFGGLEVLMFGAGGRTFVFVGLRFGNKVRRTFMSKNSAHLEILIGTA